MPYPRLHLFLLRTEADDSPEFIELAAALNRILEGSLVSVLALEVSAAKTHFPNAPDNALEWILVDLSMEVLLAASVRDYCASGWYQLLDGGIRTRSRHPICDGDLTLSLCDYLLVTKHASLYASELLPTLLPELRHRRVAVAWNYVTRKALPADEPGVCPPSGGAGAQVSAAFKAHHIEESSAVVQMEHLRRRPSLRFVLDAFRTSKDQTFDAEADHSGQFFSKLAAEPEIHKTDLVIIPKSWTLN